MSGDAKDREEVTKLLNEIAEAAVMLDLSCLPDLAALCKQLRDLAAGCGKLGLARGEQAATKTAALIELIIFEQVPDTGKALGTINDTISALQSLVSGRSDVVFPASLGLDDLTASSAPAQSRDLAAGVDDGIFEAFIEQQLSVLPDIENHILAFEKDGSKEHIAALRRLIHTMKGEAGMVGISEIQEVCHKFEDYTDAGSKVSVDVLFQTKDWLLAAAEARSAGKKEPLPAALLEIYKNASAPVNVEPAPVAPPPPPPPPPPAETAPAPQVQEEALKISDPDLTKDFVTEAQEHFEIADQGLLTLESNPADEEAVGAVFRSFHTIKGVSGFLGLTPIGSLAHKAETLFDDVRKGKRKFEGKVADLTFASLDMLKQMVGDLGKALASGRPFQSPAGLRDLINGLEAIISGKVVETQHAAPKPAAAQPAAAVQAPAAQAPAAEHRPEVAAPVPAQAEPAAAQGEQAAGAAAKDQGESGIQQTVKIDAERLDLLIDTIGELVIAESIVAQDPEIVNLKSLRIEKHLSHLGKITRLLQDMGMAMRMMPVEPTFRKMARLVRDLAKKAGKQIEFSMTGQETEIDRGMVDKLGDPLIHMIRNSVDHGIEASPADRVAAGKDPTGHIQLKAYHKSGNIHIEIVDDGKGIDREAIIAKAIEKGMITSADKMSDREIYGLIFEAGFSTAKQITEISGRGVGMDVVRRNIESLRGNVLIETEKGKGSTFTLVLPLTTAIIDGMAVKVGDETYIIPTLSIIESFRPSPEMISTLAGKGQLIAFRNSNLPLFSLGKLFSIAGAKQDPSEAIVIILEEGGKKIGLVVDYLIGQQQTVIKSMSEAMGPVPGVSGASIMADGKPGLIIDVAGVVKLATSIQD